MGANRSRYEALLCPANVPAEHAALGYAMHSAVQAEALSAKLSIKHFRSEATYEAFVAIVAAWPAEGGLGGIGSVLSRYPSVRPVAADDAALAAVVAELERVHRNRLAWTAGKWLMENFERADWPTCARRAAKAVESGDSVKVT